MTVDAREFSAGGVLVRDGAVAVIRPHGRPKIIALPKGHIDTGETAAQAAEREVREETGLVGSMTAKLGDVRYVYRFKGKTIFKVVSFFLFDWSSGEIDQLSEAMRVEVDKAYWLPLNEALKKLSYPGERQMAGKAWELIASKHSRP